MAVSTTERDEDLARGLIPWVTISTMPRATIRAIIDRDPRRHVLLLAVLSGLAWPLPHVFVAGVSSAEVLPALPAVRVAVGALASVIALYMNGWLFRVVGGWLGGRATSAEIRAAFAWSTVPLVILLLPAYAPAYVAFGAEALASGTAGIALGVLAAMVRLWVMGLTFVCLAEVHRFSVARALGTFLLALVLVGLIVGVPVGVIAALSLH